MKRVLRSLTVATALLLSVVGCASAQKDYTDPATLATLVAEGEEPYLLVDVRTAEEYSAGHIPTAANIPVDAIGGQPPTTDKNALIIVYCRSGSRSAAAKRTLDALGYTKVLDFGSVSRWKGELKQGDEP